MSEITFVPGHATGFATVQPHGADAERINKPNGRVVREILEHLPQRDNIRLVSTQASVPDGDDLESAATVVVGGAGLGSMENFGQVRQLAVTLAGQVAAAAAWSPV